MPPELGGTPVEAERGQASADGDATSAARGSSAAGGADRLVRRQQREEPASVQGAQDLPDRRRGGDPGGGRDLAPVWLMGGGGALIVVVEGLQQLQQYQQNWTAYRSTCERLKHEKFLYLARAGPYVMASNRDSLLAARVEGLVSQEHAAWVSHQHEETTKETGAE